MIDLARFVIQQRWRKLTLQHRWPVLVTLGGLLVLLALRAGYVAPRIAAMLTPADVARTMATLWMGWVLLGTISGRDLTWHLPLERLVVLPVPFRKLYALDLLLAWLSAPVLALLAGVVTAAVRFDRGFQSAAAMIAEAFLFVYTVRSTVSVARSFLLSSEFQVAVRVAALVLLSAGAAAVWQSNAVLDAAAYLVVALIAVDYATRRRVVLSGNAGSRPIAASHSARWLQLTDSPRTVLWLLTLVSWLRNRNALLLLLWGMAYGFLYTYVTEPQDQSYFLLFTWMVLMFHSYLRGNVLGLDNRAAWAYFMFPGAGTRVVAFKHATLTLLQIVMVLAVLAPAVIHTARGLSTPIAWVMVLSYALSAVALSELSGTFFSILHAEPIERGSMYSGGTTAGAIVIPILQFVLVGLFGLATVKLRTTIGQWLFATITPGLLCSARLFAGNAWLRLAMSREREELLGRLSSVSL